MLLRRVVGPAIAVWNRQCVKSRGDPPLVAQFFVKRETGFQKVRSRRKIPLRCGQRTEKMSYPGSLRGMTGARETQNRLQAGPALGQVFPHVPEPEQGHTKPQTPVQIPG